MTWWLLDHGAWVWPALVAISAMLGSTLPGSWMSRRARAFARDTRRRFRETGVDEASDGAEACVRGKLRTGVARFDMASAPPSVTLDVAGQSLAVVGPFVIECGTRERWPLGRPVARTLGDGDEVLAAGTWRRVTVAGTGAGYREAPDASFELVARPDAPVRLAAAGAPRVDPPHAILRVLALAVSGVAALAIAHVVGALAMRAASSPARRCGELAIGAARLVALASPRRADAVAGARDDLRSAPYLPRADRERLLDLDGRLGGCADRAATFEARGDVAELVQELETCETAKPNDAARVAFEHGWFAEASALYDRARPESLEFGELERIVGAHLAAGRRASAIEAARAGAELLAPLDPRVPRKSWVPPPRMASTPIRRERLECVADGLEAMQGPEREPAFARLRASKRPECQLLLLDALPWSQRRAELARLGGRFAITPGTPAQRRALELLLVEGALGGDFAPPAFPADTADLAWNLLSDAPRVLRDRVPGVELLLAQTLYEIGEPTSEQRRARVEVGPTAAAIASLVEKHEDARAWVGRVLEDVEVLRKHDASRWGPARAPLEALRAAVELRAGALGAARQAALQSDSPQILWALELLEGKKPPPPADWQDAWRYNTGWAELAPSLAAQDWPRAGALARCGTGVGTDLFALAAPHLARDSAELLDAVRWSKAPRTAHTEGLYGHFTEIATHARLVAALGDEARAVELRMRATAIADAMTTRMNAIVLLVLWNQ